VNQEHDEQLHNGLNTEHINSTFTLKRLGEKPWTWGI